MDHKLQPKNPALYCISCLGSTEEFDVNGTQFLRLEDPLGKKTTTLCKPCINKLNQKFLIVKDQNPEKTHFESITPKFIFDYLNLHIIGQEQAKKSLSVAITNHYRKLAKPSLDKSNILILGPTGTGKTEMIRIIADLLKIPLVINDATSLTAHGYVGEDVEVVLQQLLIKANNNLKLAEQGIVVIDEFDKLAYNGDSGVNTTSVQQSLLKMLEGGIVKVNKNNRRDQGEFINFNTSKVLFILCGAFDGLTSGQKNSIGISDRAFIKEDISTDQLTQYGIIPEILGRLPVTIKTNPLSEQDLKQILTHAPNSITKQFIDLLKCYNIDLSFSDCFLTQVAKEALKLNTGARGLRAILENKLNDVLFEAPTKNAKKVIVSSQKTTYKK